MYWLRLDGYRVVCHAQAILVGIEGDLIELESDTIVPVVSGRPYYPEFRRFIQIFMKSSQLVRTAIMSEVQKLQATVDLSRRMDEPG